MASYTKFRNGFEITSGAAIDKRILLTKAEMLVAEETYIIPDKYFALCADADSTKGEPILYIFDNTSTWSTETGHYHPIDVGGGEYTAGTGIKIEGNVISVDTTVIATLAKLNEQIGVVASQITAETSRATQIEAGLSSRIATIEGDYLKASDKAELQAAISAEAVTRASMDTNLSQRIDALEGRGRFLSKWNCTTGLPQTEPIDVPYTYKSGDYYLVALIDSTTNYRPSGKQYTGAASTEVETEAVTLGDTYYFDGTGWLLVHAPEKQVAWGEITGTLANQSDLQAALNAKASEGYVDAKVATEKARAEGVEAQLSAAISTKSTVSVSASGTATTEVQYITVDGSEYKLAGGHGEPEQYVKDITQSGNSLTITKKDDSTFTYTPDYSNLATKAEVQAEASLRSAADLGLDAKISEKSKVVPHQTGTSTEEVNYLTIDGHEYKIVGTGSQPTPPQTAVYQGEIARGGDHQAKIAELTSGKTVNKGDVCIIKELINDTAAGTLTEHRQYTAYVYDGTVWAAMDGNYDAENVFFANDLTYTKAIGELPAVPSTGAATLAAKGKNVKQIFDAILAKETNPSTVYPSVTVSSSNIGEKEAGTVIGIQYSTSYNPGSYTYGPATGCTVVSRSIQFNGQTMTGESGTFDNVTVNDFTSLKITGTFAHTQGAMPKTNLGNDYAAGRIPETAARATSEKGTLSGYRNIFYGTFASTETELTSANIRTLNKIKQQTFPNNGLSISIPVGVKRVVIAVPNDNETITGKSWARSVTSVKDVNDSSSEVMSAFETHEVNVEGASQHQAIRYLVYVCDYANPTTVVNTYKATVI